MKSACWHNCASCASHRTFRNRKTKRVAVTWTRTPRHPGYQINITKRKWIEHIFGWLKTIALARKVRHRGRALVEWMFVLAVSGYHLVRLARLAAERA